MLTNLFVIIWMFSGLILLSPTSAQDLQQNQFNDFSNQFRSVDTPHFAETPTYRQYNEDLAAIDSTQAANFIPYDTLGIRFPATFYFGSKLWSTAQYMALIWHVAPYTRTAEHQSYLTTFTKTGKVISTLRVSNYLEQAHGEFFESSWFLDSNYSRDIVIDYGECYRSPNESGCGSLGKAIYIVQDNGDIILAKRRGAK